MAGPGDESRVVSFQEGANRWEVSGCFLLLIDSHISGILDIAANYMYYEPRKLV